MDAEQAEQLEAEEMEMSHADVLAELDQAAKAAGVMVQHCMKDIGAQRVLLARFTRQMRALNLACDIVRGAKALYCEECRREFNSRSDYSDHHFSCAGGK